MVKVCIWMDVPSHYQSAFFNALDRRDDVDIKVCYVQGVSKARVAQGWSSRHTYQSYECCVAGLSLQERLASIPDWEEYIHIISSQISYEQVQFFCAHGATWCHWSEAPGFRLAELVSYRMRLFRLLKPLMLKSKYKDSLCLRRHALAVFGQGSMATQSFRTMGVPARKIFDLYYSPSPLIPMSPSEAVVQFAGRRNVFLNVGALCQRKGIDVLLRAFSKLDTEDWCLVLCGLDRAEGSYQALARRLGIAEQVLFLGAYPVEQIAEVYAAADVFILSSRFDGWGAVLNEAASLGLPLIGTDLCGASWHIIKEGVNGLRVKSESLSSLKKAMKFYVMDTEKISFHGKASKEIYFNEFTPERNALRLIEGLKASGGIIHEK